MSARCNILSFHACAGVGGHIKPSMAHCLQLEHSNGAAALEQAHPRTFLKIVSLVMSNFVTQERSD